MQVVTPVQATEADEVLFEMPEVTESQLVFDHAPRCEPSICPSAVDRVA